MQPEYQTEISSSSQPNEQSNAFTSEYATLSVRSPQLDVAKSHYTYLISGEDQIGQIEIRRRFNDFYYLRQALKKKWYGVYIPPISEKMITGNKDQSNIEMRRKFFEYFLLRLASRKHLIFCSITQEFLKNKSLDMEKFYTAFSAPSPQEQLFQYKEIYPNLQGIETGQRANSLEQKKEVGEFNIFLKRSEKELKTIRAVLSQIVEARQNFSNLLNNCTLHVLPEYEKNVYSKYLTADLGLKDTSSSNKLIFSAAKSEVQQSAQLFSQSCSTSASLQLLLNMIAYEIREIDAMQQLLSDKESYETHTKKCNQKLLSSESEISKLMGGRTTFKSLISKGNKDEQIKKLEKDIPQMRQELQNWQRLCNSISIVVCEEEIPKFKASKEKLYYDVLNQLSGGELKYLEGYERIMKGLVAVSEGKVK